MSEPLSLKLISEAAAFLEDRVRRTPLEHSPGLSDVLGVPVWLKLENLQLTGSFKIRGAWFACARLFDEGIREIATCSAGNHGLGVAFSAKDLGMKAKIFVPSSVDEGRLRTMTASGAEVVVSEFPGYDETERWARVETSRMGIPFLSAFDDTRVMAGNGGSVALEVLNQLPNAATFVMPAGGGGHAAGFCFAVSERLRTSQFIICQHRQSPALRLSLAQGTAVTEMPAIETLAHGLEGGFGVQTFSVLKELVSHVSLVSEEEIRDAMVWMLDSHRYVVEGSAAAAIAACLKSDLPASTGPVVVFVSGRNVGLSSIRNVLCGSRNG